MQKFEPGESVSYTEILGNAVYFGIVANTVNKQAHMDSNFATKVLNGASGNVTTGAYTENGAVYLVASVPNGGVLEMDGKSNILWCPEENRNNFKVKGTIETYPKETLDAYVDSMINHVSQKSTTIGNRNGYIVDNLANSKTIDIENCEAGTYYFDMSNYAQYGIDDLKIKKKSNQVVVLNYPTSNKVTLKRFELVNDGVSVSSATSNQTVDKLCRSIIFNMPQATEIDFASATAGLFIAPKATVTGLGGTSSGWIVVNSFTNNGGEWHCVYGELPKPENVEKPAQESFSVSKTVDGSTPTVDQKFVFRLEQIGDVPNGTTPISAKTVENNGAKVDFGTIKYNKEGTYYYKITETGKAATTSGEYTLDSQSYVVKVVVTANVTSSGNITTTEYNKVTTYYKGDTVNACTEENKVTGTTGITFNNETIEQKGGLKIVKAAGAGTDLVGKTFYFKISDEGGNVVKNSNNSDVWSIIFSANVENAINIENLEPGKYRVSETDANGNGVTTGEAFPYVVTVTGGGLVTVEGNKTTNVVVTNTKYEAAGSLALTAEKKLEGKQLEAGKYSFVLKDSKGTELQTKQNSADGSVSFDAIEYTLADAGKDFTYTVAEVAGSEAGVTYDSSVYTVKVHVADKGIGTLEVTKKITRTAGEKTEEAEKIVFNNKYEAAGSLALTAEKKLEGKQLEAGKYSFVLKDSKGTELQTKQNGADGSVSFDAIGYTLADAGKDFTYTVAEVAGNEAGVTYDSSVYTVKVHVADKGTGTLEVTKKITRTAGEKTEEAEKIVFNNKYEAAGSLALTAEKKLEGKQLEAGKYSFVLKDSKGTELQTKQNGADGSVSFDAIGYTLADAGKDFTYTVAEVAGNEAGVTYDSSVYTVKVHVADKGTGTLEVTKKITRTAGEKTEEAEKIVFNNKYEAAGSLALTAEKKLEGKQLEAGKYSFVLKDSKGTELQTKQNGADGSVSFDAIGYTLADAGKDFTYTVAEVAGNEAGVTYDSSVYTVKVHVADKGTGTLEVTKKITRTAGEKTEEAEKIVFNNKYEAAGSLALTAEKKLEGKQLEAGKYSFVLKDSKGTELQTKQNGADGSVSFDAIGYTLADAGKDFTYTVAEVAGNEAGVTYDSSVYTVKVHVADKGTGTLEVTKKITRTAGEKTEEAEKIVFNNKYEAAGSLALTAEKKLEGKQLEAGKYSFVLKDSKGTELQTKQNGADGSVSFDAIGYTLADAGKDFTYTVAEVAGSEAGVTYDSSVYTVKVHVADKGTGTLEVTKKITRTAGEKTEEAEKIVFNNKYEANGSITLTATKNLNGREFRKGDKWTFTVTCDDANAPMPEHPVVTTTATSGFTTTLDFGKINYTIADAGKSYVYIITETGNVANVTNDPVAARTVTVSVRDKGDGTLNVTQEVTGAGLTFTNKYADGETTLGVTKVLSGREFKSGDEWTFKLTAEEGTPMPAQTVVKTNATSGYTQSLSFGTIKYTLADVGNTYTYTIQETGSAEGVTNDPNATRTVTVTVNEGKDGKLDIVREEPKGEIVFTNTYDAKGSLTLEASKTLKNKALEADAFNFVLKDENGETIQTVANDADGNVTFSPLNYTLKDVGTHVYTVSEVQRENTEVTYDTTEYTVEVTVADAGNGKLKVSKTIKKGDDTVDAIAFENIYKGVIDISGSKTWNDADNQDGIRPASITVKLFANGTEAASQVVTPDEAGNWNVCLHRTCRSMMQKERNHLYSN